MESTRATGVSVSGILINQDDYRSAQTRLLANITGNTELYRSDVQIRLTKALWDHARLGGSRAQRGLIENASVGVLLRLGRHDEARRQPAMQRPKAIIGNALKGM